MRAGKKHTACTNCERDERHGAHGCSLNLFVYVLIDRAIAEGLRCARMGP